MKTTILIRIITLIASGLTSLYSMGIKEEISQTPDTRYHSETFHKHGGHEETPPVPYITNNNSIIPLGNINTFMHDEHSIAAGNVQTYILNIPGDGSIHSFNLPTDRRADAFAIKWHGEQLRISMDGSLLTDVLPDTEGEQISTRYISSLISLEEGQDQILLNSATDQEIELHLYYPSTEEEYQERTLSNSSGYSPLATNYYNQDAGAKFTTLDITSRDEWGANPGSWDGNSSVDIDSPLRLTWEPYYYRVSKIIIHHTVTTNNYTNGAAQVRSIYLYHAYTRGWGDVGYNYLIDKYGNIYEGKAGGDEVYGYHAYTPANRMSIGISMIGDFTYSAPTTAARTALSRLIAEKANFYDFPTPLRYSSGSEAKWLNVGYTVYGHRDSYFYCYESHPLYYLCSGPNTWRQNATACPGNTFHGYLSGVTSDAQAYRGDSRFTDLNKVVRQVENTINYGNWRGNVIEVKFDLPESASEAQILAKIPSYSGITNISIDGNIAYLTISDWNTSGGRVPPVGYVGGSLDSGSFFPASGGPADRMKTLLKIFRLRDDVVYADVNLRMELY